MTVDSAQFQDTGQIGLCALSLAHESGRPQRRVWPNKPHDRTVQSTPGELTVTRWNLLPTAGSGKASRGDDRLGEIKEQTQPWEGRGQKPWSQGHGQSVWAEHLGWEEQELTGDTAGPK